MDRWLFGFVTGCISSLFWPYLPPFLVLLVALPMALVALVRRYLLCSGLVVACCWIASVGHWQLHWQLPLENIPHVEVLQGEVVSLAAPPEVDAAKRFVLKVRTVNGETQWPSFKVRLSWFQQPMALQQGDRVQLAVKLKAPRGLMNQGGFDYQRWLFSQSIVATGYVKNSPHNRLLKRNPSVRQQLLNRFWQQPLQYKQWLAALSIGYRDQLTPEDWRAMQATGTAHLFAISGLHLGLVATFSFIGLKPLVILLLRALQSVWQPLPNARHITLLISLIPTWCYAALAGFSLPTIRAWLMYLVAVLLLVNFRHWRWRSFFVFSFFLVCVLFPQSLFSLGFWLSFGAVAAIAFLSWRWPVTDLGTVKSYFALLLRMQLGLSLLMLPVVAWQFSLLSWGAPFINLVAIPLVSLLILPMCLLATLGLLLNFPSAESLFVLADQLMGWGVQHLMHITEFAWSTARIAYAPSWCWGVLIVAIVGSLMPKLPVPRLWLLLLMLPVFSYQLPTSTPGWHLDVLDVGNGLALMIRKNRRVLLYDVGARFPSGFNMADSAILPVLNYHAIDKVDRVFISHDDNDHSGSLEPLRQQIAIEQLIAGKACRRGKHWQWQGLDIRALWPDQGVYSSNDGSCVLHISDGRYSALFTGDISQRIEQKLVLLEGSDLQADILIAPHHGSSSSSSLAFIDAVRPRWVIFSQGFENRWGFPTPGVVQRYTNAGVTPLLTSELGQISLHLQPDGELKWRSQRQANTAFWLPNPD